MGRTFAIHLQMPDGSLFQGDAPIRGGAAAWADFVLMAWLHPPDRALDGFSMAPRTTSMQPLEIPAHPNKDMLAT